MHCRADRTGDAKLPVLHPVKSAVNEFGDQIGSCSDTFCVDRL